ncbi:MAG: tryptophan synthase subunit alpha, partial [Bacilli bacterium]
PIYCGVGISSPEDIRRVKEAGADGALVGSLVLKLHNDIPKMSATIRALKAAAE